MSSDQDNNGAPRLAPRPVSRPPVDAASRQAFGRPDGVQGSFVADRVRPSKYRDSGRVHPAHPTRRPGSDRGVRSPLRREPTRCSATRPTPTHWTTASRRDLEDPEDPWRDPGAAAALGEPAVAPSAQALRRRPRRARGARRAVRRPGLVPGAVGARRARIADRLGRRCGRTQDGRGRRGVHHLQGDAVDESQQRVARRPVRQGRCASGRFSGHDPVGQRPGGHAGFRLSSSTAAATSSPTTTSSPKRPTTRASSRPPWCSTTARKCPPTWSAATPGPTWRCSRSTTSTTSRWPDWATPTRSASATRCWPPVRRWACAAP